jgi:hypothetical protein
MAARHIQEVDENGDDWVPVEVSTAKWERDPAAYAEEIRARREQDGPQFPPTPEPVAAPSFNERFGDDDG